VSDKICVVCFVDLPKRRRKFCSYACEQKNRFPGAYSNCRVCQKTFKRTDGSVYCSDICRDLSTPHWQNESQQKYRLKKFGLTKNQYEQMFENQDGKCAICHNAEVAVVNGKVKQLSIDHCHNTNFVRGLLCQRCNLGIGYFNDNYLLLDNALEYLIAGDIKAGTMTRMGNRNVNA
jgi:hypothetical protein